MKLTYSNSIEDWAAAQAHHLETMPGYRYSIVFWRWSFAVGLGIVAVLVADDWAAWARAALGLSFAIPVYVGYPRYARNAHRARGLAQLKVTESRMFMTCERVVEVLDEGLRIESLASSQLIKWAAIKAADETATHVFITFWFGLGLPIPKTCMTPTEKESLVTAIRTRIAPPANKPLKRSYRVQGKRTGTDQVSLGALDPFRRKK
jgi:hypothetical protein